MFDRIKRGLAEAIEPRSVWYEAAIFALKLRMRSERALAQLAIQDRDRVIADQKRIIIALEEALDAIRSPSDTPEGALIEENARLKAHLRTAVIRTVFPSRVEFVGTFERRIESFTEEEERAAKHIGPLGKDAFRALVKVLEDRAKGKEVL